MDKQELRQQSAALRDAVIERETKESSLNRHLLKFIEERSSCLIGVYFAFRNELSLQPLIETLFDKRIGVAAPFCKGDELFFTRVSKCSDLEEGSYGILEPIKSLQVSSALSIDEIELVLVPGLSFDKQGYRLGYGGGYYDRFLSKYNGTSCGIAFEEQISSMLPREDHDQKVDALATPSGITFL